MAAVLERRAPVKLKQNDWLIKHAYNITSQGGEDGVIAQIFALLDDYECSSSASPDQPLVPRRRRWCVEFGAWDGKHLSNTWQLLYNTRERWSGVLIEADAARVDQMRAMYAAHDNVTCVNSFVELDGENRLDCILARTCPALPYDVDLLSIDVDGADYHIWQGLETYRPKVVIIEFNPTIPNNVVYIQERSTNIYHGSSLAALVDLAKHKGYELVSTTTFNAFFVRHEYYTLFHIEDNAIDKMHDVPMPTEFFQLYDGTIKITGCKKLIWKQIPIEDKDIQVLPPSARAFPFLPREHDAMTTADKRLQECLETKEQDFEQFITIARASVGKYDAQDIRKVLQYALRVCYDHDTRENAATSAWAVCDEVYTSEFAASQYIPACDWLQAMLDVRPRCTPLERADVLTKMGECLVRARQFERAEFYLQTALAIEPNAKSTLKSLAKLYTKTKQTKLVEETVERIRKLTT